MLKLVCNPPHPTIHCHPFFCLFSTFTLQVKKFHQLLSIFFSFFILLHYKSKSSSPIMRMYKWHVIKKCKIKRKKEGKNIKNNVACWYHMSSLSISMVEKRKLCDMIDCHMSLFFYKKIIIMSFFLYYYHVNLKDKKKSMGVDGKKRKKLLKFC